MKKKLIIIMSTLLIVLSIATYSILSSLAIKKYISKDMKINFPDKFIAYQVVRCDFGISNIEYAFIGEYKDRIDNLKTFFYEMKRKSLFTVNDWSDNYIGGTTIKNTTFPQLVAMVKEDCSQFQKGKGDYWGEDIAWSHTPAPTKEELDERHVDSMRSDFVDLSEESREIFYRVYGVTHKDMTTNDEKTLEIYNKIEKDEGLHSDVQAQIQLEEDGYQRKVESGEIVIKSKPEQMRDAGIDEEIIQLYVEQTGGVYIAPE